MCRSNKEFVALVEIFEPQVILKVFEYSILGMKPNREPPHPLPRPLREKCWCTCWAQGDIDRLFFRASGTDWHHLDEWSWSVSPRLTPDGEVTCGQGDRALECSVGEVTLD